MKTFIFSVMLCCIIVMPAIAELTPEDINTIREIVDISADTISHQINYILVLVVATMALLIITIHLPNIIDMYKTGKEYQYKKLESRIQTLEQETDKETQ